MDELLRWIYGKSARNAHIREMAKKAIDAGMQADLKTALTIEAQCFSLCYGTEDKSEGTRAFMEKRKPNFKGR